MFERIIEFSASETYLKNYSDKPEPIKLNIPQWFKDLEHHPRYKTIKGCQPFFRNSYFWISFKDSNRLSSFI